MSSAGSPLLGSCGDKASRLGHLVRLGMNEKTEAARARREREDRRRLDIEEQTRLRALRAFSHLLPVLAFIYAAAAGVFFLVPPFFPSMQYVQICSIAAAVTLVLWGVTPVDDSRFEAPVTLCTIVVALGVGLSMLAVSGSLANTTTLAISLVAAGAHLYRFSMYVAMIATVFIGWVPLARGAPFPEYVLAAFFLWSAAVVGWLLLWSRRRLMITLLEEADEALAMRRLATEQTQKLVRARDAALASAQAKGQFLANVSHEVRTPLNGILGLLQLIDPNKLPEPQSDYLREVRRASRSLLAIVNDLLDLSKIEAGEMRLESVPFDLVETTEEITLNYRSAAAAKGIDLVTEVDAEVPEEVCGDALRLRQVLSNLLNNAIKFTREGQVRIGVCVLERDASHVEIEFRISDTGIGIPEHQAEKIFRPFSQADASTTREYGGTGLGLSICMQLVELMGGALRVESAAGEGSTFFFSARFDLEQQLSGELEAVVAGLAGMQVLLLESNHRARETLNAQLQSWNMEVWTTANFDGATRVLETPPYPDVTIIDLRSLGKDWRTRAHEIAISAARAGSSLIAICAHRHDINDMVDAGVYVHIQRPIRRAKVVAALLKTLHRSTEIEPLPSSPCPQTLPVAITESAVSNGMRVLVAEDNPLNLKVAKAHLDALGYEVDGVPDGEAALEALTGAHSYAAVLMDGQMPKMDGYEAARALRAHEVESGQARVPIIALTAHAMSGDRRAAFAAGMDDYLSKPFTQKQLQMALARWAARPDTRASMFPANALDTSITAQLLDLEQEEPGFLCEVIDSFFQTAEDNLGRMRAAIRDGDLRALRAAAHMVRGSSQQLGVRRFGMTCQKLEGLERVDEADAIVTELEGDLEGAREALTGLADRALDAAS